MTMTQKAPKADVGAIIGRFQVHELHEAHKDLIDSVRAMHDNVFIFIGLSPLRNTIRNPLDFNTRKRMIQEAYPDVEVYYVEDNRDDKIWSKNLDREIQKWLKPHQSILLYGSRDSFISHYHGKHTTVELESSTFISGTEIRRRIANNFTPTKEFRAGVISASFNRYPTAYAAVDCAIIDWDKKRLLLGQKKGEEQLRFIGGFSDPTSPSYEADAKREVMEETGLEIGEPLYLGSSLVDDWRYRGEVDKIKSSFFVAPYLFGRPEANDDIASVHWVTLADFVNGKIEIVNEHKPFIQMLIDHLPPISELS
jgi:bifunctional NMN adenylyltransferase/nudix hydrolase